MLRRDNLCYHLIFLLALLVVKAHARSWDLAVAIGREIDFYAKNGTLTGQAQIKEAVNLRALAYDDVTRTMYLSDTRSNFSIFSYNLNEKNFTVKPLLQKRSNSLVISMVFDPSSRTLFWIDSQREREVIMKMEVLPDGSPGEAKILHDLKSQGPRDIALDVCNSHVYWVNSNTTNPSVERSNLDGSDRVTVIKENMYEPLSVAIDHAEGKLYWIDDDEGIHFKIERSNLDGSEREQLLHNRHQTPIYLAVDQDSIYWSDWSNNAVWTMSKNTTIGHPKIFKSFAASNRDTDPAGILTRDNAGKVDCQAIARMQKRMKLINQVPMHTTIENYNNLTTSTEESDFTTERSTQCLNDGFMDNKDGTCQCKPGFSGARCEMSLCHNYCLRGNCKINSRGLPECECASTFSGSRCEKDVCEGYCLHEGQCAVENGKPTCKCKYSEGIRCENLDIAAVCAMLCANGQQNPSGPDANPCRCAEANHTAERMSSFTESFEYGTLLPIMSAVIAVLVILVIVLSYYVNKFRRRPRIKKRFVVSKGGVTPLTSRPQIPDNQCEITIENCCNMNICETPCFEPKLRTGVPRSHSTKKEEKNSLLDNMEGNSC